MTQQILILTTEGPSLRSEVVGRTAEDPALFADDRPIGLTPTAKFRSDYTAPLAALANHWKLLAPPVSLGEGCYEWWFAREQE